MKKKLPYLIFSIWFAFLANNLVAQTRIQGEPVFKKQSAIKNSERINFTPNIRAVKIFPDEITSYVYIHIGGQSTHKAYVLIKDSFGRTVIEDNINIGQTEKYSVNNLPRGQYNVCISIAGMVIKNQTIILI